MGPNIKYHGRVAVAAACGVPLVCTLTTFFLSTKALPSKCVLTVPTRSQPASVRLVQFKGVLPSVF